MVPTAATRLALLWILTAALVPATPGASAGSPRFRGRRLAEVLEELQRGGLKVIFSSAIVGPELVVDEPIAVTPRAILDQILAPLGLRGEDGAQGTVLVVRAPPPAAPAPARDAPVEGARFVEDILVTPAHHRIVPDDPGVVRSLDGDDVIAAPVLGNDPSRMVTLLPGIAAADTSAAFNARGSDTRDVSLVLDGLELYDPFHLSAWQSPFSFVDGRIVNSIDFLDGGFTADRGDRHGGFLDISSGSPVDGAATQIETGTLNTRIAYDAPTRIGDLLVSARYWYPEAAGNTITFGADGLRPKLADLYAKLQKVLSPQTTVSGHVLLASDRATLVEADGNERLTASNGSGYAWLRLSRSWATAVSSDTVVSAGRLDRSRRGIGEPGDELVSLDDRRTVQFAGVKTDVNWSLGGAGVLRGGVNFQMLEADLAYTSGPSGVSSTVAADRSGASIGAYAAYRAAIGRRLTVEGGLRWDRQTYAGDRQWSPRLNLAWRPAERTEFRLGAGQYAQSLRIHELRIEDGETEYGPPELCRQLDVTYLQRFPRWSLRVDAYRHQLGRLHPRYENLFHPIELFPELEPDRVLVDSQSATLQGVEVSARSSAGSPLQWWASYTWSSATDVVSGVEVPRSWDQTHAGNFLVSYRWRPGWFASLTGTIHTGWPTTPVTGRLVVLPDGSTSIEPSAGPRNSERFPTYVRLDLKAGRAISTAKGSLRIELSIMNVTDRKNACCIDEVQIAPALDHWLGIAPSLQVLWTF